MRTNIEISLPDEPFAGCIFDCDGTLIHSMPVHMKAWNRSVRTFGAQFQLDPESFMEVAGVGGIDTVRHFNRRFREKIPPAQAFDLKEEIYLSLLDEVEPIDEVVAIARAMARRYPVSVASGGPRHVVEAALEKTGLRSLFPVIVTQDDITRSKPDPEIFLLAAERMGVSPAECVVFEDSPLGIDGARAAGMRTVLIPNLMAIAR